tara:strand:+ start:632 stop:748 length:117 start_codon:yes stop_codon:yes gene_type:complete
MRKELSKNLDEASDGSYGDEIALRVDPICGFDSGIFVT